MFKKRKLISIMLTASMMLTLFPFAAFAEEGGQTGTEQGQQEPAQSAEVATELPEADKNGVITLTQDVKVTSLDADKTYDLKGHKLILDLSNNAPSIVVGANSILTIKDSSVVAPNKGGTLELTGTANAFINPQKGGTVNVENVKVTCTGSAFLPQGDAAAVNITNCDVIAKYYGVATNAAKLDNYGVKINLKDSTFKGDGSSYDNTPVFLNVDGTLTMDGCTVIGDRQAVLVRAGNANITNSDIILTGNFADNKNYENGTWGTGNEVPMAALLVGDKTSGSYDADAIVNVSNTTVKSEGQNAKPAIYVSAEKGEKAQFNTALTLDKATVTGNIVTADAAVGKTATNVTLQNGTTVDGTVKVGAQKGDVVVKNSTVTAVETTQGHGNNVVIDNSTVTNALPEGNDFTVVDSNIGGQQVGTNKAAMIGNTAYDTLDAAIQAAIKSNADTTIVVLKDAKIDAAQYVINNKITLQKSASATTAPKIDVTVASGETTIAFDLQQNAGLTLDGVAMTVKGTKNVDTAKNNDGTAFNVNHSDNEKVPGANLTLENGAVLTVTNLERGLIFSGNDVKTQATVNVNPGTTMNITNIDGNASNGGEWSVDKATLNVKNCGELGLSAQKIVAKNGATINVDSAGKTGVLAKDLTLENGSDLNVINCGAKLPFDSKWSPDNISYKNAVEIKKDGHVSLSGASEINLTNNKNQDGKDINNVYLPKGDVSVSQNSSVNGNIVNGEPAKGDYRVEYIVNGEVYYSVTVTAENSKVSYTAPKNPSRSGYTFEGWDYNGVKVDVATDNKASFKPVDGKNVYIFDAEFSKNSSTPAVTEYSVTVKKTDNGSVTVSPKKAEDGDKVTITVDPDKGYVVDAVVVTDKDGDKITVTKKSATKYTFTMPKSRVDVKVTFKAEQTEPEQPSEMPFVDVVKDAWYYPAVEYVYNNELMNGTNGGLTFEPNVNLNRAMMAAVLYNMEGGPDCDKSGLFSDVADGMWYTDAVNWAASNNIVSGMPDGTYAPNQALTREQMASILYRYAEYKGIDTDARADLGKFTDGNTTSAWATDVVQWAVAEKLINGVGTELQPKGTASRAQVATVLMNYCENVAK